MGYISRFTTVHKSWKLNSSRGSSMMDGRSYSSWHWSKLLRVGLLACAWTIPPCLTAANEKRQVPHHVPPKRSSQIQSGFGINSNLPREPYLPWERWWWTRMFDAGVSWIRIGQYENSSEPTSWDWIEQKRGVYAAPPGLDDYVDSLVENGVKIQAKVIYGGQAAPSRDFTRRALDTCQCASGIDVYAYHTYPGYGQNLNPESMDYGAYGQESPSKLREMVRDYPGIRPDIEYWDDEFNSVPSWRGSDESVQAKYVPRGLIYNWAAGVRTFVWLLAAGTDGNEYDDFGLIHGLRYLPDAFTPRPGL